MKAGKLTAGFCLTVLLAGPRASNPAGFLLYSAAAGRRRSHFHGCAGNFRGLAAGAGWTLVLL